MISKQYVIALLLALSAGLPASALWDLFVRHVIWRGSKSTAYEISVSPKRQPLRFWGEAIGYVLLICAILASAAAIGFG